MNLQQKYDFHTVTLKLMTHSRTENFVPWSALTRDELYAILQLRQVVFVVEQQCPYLDCDDRDQHSLHYWISDARGVVAYARIAPPGVIYPEAAIGRVVTAERARCGGLGRAVMEASLRYTDEHYPGPVRIMAQSYLLAFYESLGFARCGKEFLEDGLPHWEMIRANSEARGEKRAT